MKTCPLILRLVCLLLIATGIAEAGFAQTAELDSLERVAATSTDDTLRIDALIRLGQRLRNADLNHSADVLTTALEEAKKSGDLRRELRAINSLGVTYGMKEDYAGSLEQFKKALALHTRHGNLTGMADSYNNLGIVYKSIGDYPRSLEVYFQSLQLNDSIGNQSGRAASFHNIGVVYDMMGEMDKALDYFQRAVRIQEAIHDEDGRSLALHSIALVYERQGKYPEALDLLFEHLEILKKQGDQVREAVASNTIGKLYLASGAYEAATVWLNQSLEKCRALGLRQPMAETLYNLAELHLHDNDTQKAIAALKEHLAIAGELNNFVLQNHGHDLMANIFARLGDYRAAFLHQQQAVAFRDSLFNQDKTQAFQQWQARLEVYEKNRQLDQQTHELQWLETRARLDRQFRWALLLALVLTGFAAVLFFQKYRLRQQTNLALREKTAEIEAQKAEIEATSLELERRMLRAQMNPHFIFNSLGAIQHFITAKDQASALKYLSRFSSLLRQVLEDSVTNIVVLEEEIKLLKIYLELEALRFDQGFSYEVEVHPDLDPYTAEVPLLLIQPFVENAILHGLMPKNGERCLHISFFREGNCTVCRITDNGIGRKAAAELKAQKAGSRPSRGLEVTLKRLEALNKTNDAQTLVSIHDRFHDDGSPAGTEVVIQIPMV